GGFVAGGDKKYPSPPAWGGGGGHRGGQNGGPPPPWAPFWGKPPWGGALKGGGTRHSLIASVCGSNMPMPLPPYSANHSRLCSSTRPRRGRDSALDVGQIVTSSVLASRRPMLPPPNSS